MIVDTIDLLTKFYGNATYGINAQLAKLQSGSYASPTSVVVIASELDNTKVAQDRVPAGLPNISVVMPVSDHVQPNILTSFREGKIVLDTRYCISQTDASKGVVNNYQAVQAILHCLDAFVSNGLSNFREQNGVMILGMSSDIQIFNPYSMIGDAVEAITVRTIFDVRDLQTYID